MNETSQIGSMNGRAARVQHAPAIVPGDTPNRRAVVSVTTPPVPRALGVPPREARGLRAMDTLWKHAVLGRLRELTDGTLRLVDGAGRIELGAPPVDLEPLAATVRVHDPAFYRRMALRGLVGAAEAYVDGHWDSDDLTALVRLMARNRGVMERADSGAARLAAPWRRLFGLLRRNTRSGSRRNIADHYDLGNEFFELFLDPTLTYSSGIFETDSTDLEQAAVAKNERVCRKLEISEGDHVLEIGSGWGGFAIHAARTRGCRVTTVTISRRQHELARRRVAEAGLADLVEVVLRDYRELDGRYDKLVSIEMIEAVGHQYLDTYFRACSERLRPNGAFLLEAITVTDQDWEASKRSVEFIKRYIFPGGSLPSVWAIADSTKRVSDMRMLHLEEISEHYARTLAEWRRRMQVNRERMRALGLPESFLRMWEFYLCYCEGGFAERIIGTVQILFEKPRGRRAPVAGPISASISAPSTAATVGAMQGRRIRHDA